MSISTLLPYIQIAISVLLVTGVMLQYSEAGLGSAFGGGDSFSSTRHTRRGFEKFLFTATIVLAVLFAIVSILAFIY